MSSMDWSSSAILHGTCISILSLHLSLQTTLPYLETSASTRSASLIKFDCIAATVSVLKGELLHIFKCS